MNASVPGAFTRTITRSASMSASITFRRATALRLREYGIFEVEDDRVRPVLSLAEALRTVRGAEQQGRSEFESHFATPSGRQWTRTDLIAVATTVSS